MDGRKPADSYSHNNDIRNTPPAPLQKGAFLLLCGDSSHKMRDGVLSAYEWQILVAGIDASAGAGFLDDDLAQSRERRKQANPKPTSKILAGRVLQTLYFVQIIVVDLLFDGLEGLLDVCEVDDPTQLRVDWTANMDADAEAVTVETSAFVPRRDIR
jgi:hypothetical protein